MSAFLRFTLLVAALCAAAVVGYVVGVRKAGPSAAPDERMTIDAHGTSGPRTGRPMTPKAPPSPQPDAANAMTQEGGARNADDAGPPTSIDEILRRQSSQPQPQPAD